MEPLISVDERVFLQRRSKWLVVIACVCGVSVDLVMSSAPSGPLIGLAIWAAWLGSWALFIWGCADLARSKGYPWQYGFFGVIWLIGYAIIRCMHDRWLTAKHQPTTARVEDTNNTRYQNRL